jgi:hypothetical protein
VRTFRRQRSLCSRAVPVVNYTWYVAFQYNYAGRYNLPKFLRLVHEAGMYVSLRIGPYVCAEWNSGYAVISYIFKSHRHGSYIVEKISIMWLFRWASPPIIRVFMGVMHVCNCLSIWHLLDMSTGGFPLGYVLCQALSSALTMSPSRYLQILALDCYCAMDAIVK